MAASNNIPGIRYYHVHCGKCQWEGRWEDLTISGSENYCPNCGAIFGTNNQDDMEDYMNDIPASSHLTMEGAKNAKIKSMVDGAMKQLIGGGFEVDEQVEILKYLKSELIRHHQIQLAKAKEHTERLAQNLSKIETI